MKRCIALCVMLVGVAAAYNTYGSCDSYNAETVNEGMCPHRYQDSLGIWTIGIGFNLQQSGASSILSGCGGNFAALNAGPNSCKYQGDSSQIISSTTATCLLNHYLSTAETCLQGIFGSQWSSLPGQVRSGLIDMTYNMGCGGVKQFSTTLAHIKAGAYSTAAASAKQSKWCTQIGARCTRTTNCIANVGGSTVQPVAPPPPPPPPVQPPPPPAGSGYTPPAGSSTTPPPPPTGSSNTPYQQPPAGSGTPPPSNSNNYS